ncbi:TSL-kinase interacting protein 1 isoform X1 [Sesamum indicum]|uniref:TSL-kinase interacting protein 1 isoform X1 n=1 Tax=Sesamum indicum TaxID=4182 RepID=A0A6I9T306_SESIN|nr:TSL-kinase interacting protein 1 isoform X1 [Sesamum indicum]
MVSQVSLDCELCLGSENLGNKDGGSSVPSFSQEHAAPQMPVKKQTRQWAAWTRQEEESFFAALRQVGKNFEKITCRVQSKNKDQVRHYYYRLVRRMNKLLGPELCLDAKNSKDTNAAMLRWWSLLEKYSCKASKLHLKPRRFKIFVETLENQLLKDRKKNIKKRLSTGENNSSIPNIPAGNQVRASGHDNRAVKMVLVDSQNIQKVGTGKGALFKRHINIGMSRTNCKVDPASMKTAKHRRKTGLASTAAYKRWEKAAIAGVSLVADAAEHLERVDTDKEIDNVQETPGHDGSQLVGKVVQSLHASSQSMFNENNIHNSAKLKLQLFPIDECTRKALEMDNHNPHLELTLSTRKKLSSILEHLNRKWGNSSSLSKELMLFPYWAQRENLVGYQKWTKDSPLCAADVYYLIGSPPIFRLRYGWFSKAEVESATAQALSCANIKEQNLNINIAPEQNAEAENPNSPLGDQLVSAEKLITLSPSSTRTPITTVECGVSVSKINTSRFQDSTAGLSSLREESGDLAVTRQVENMKNIALSTGEWADSLTNISVGDLLSESTQSTDVNCTEFPMPLGSNCFQQMPFSCDSFDAAIAAHIYKHQNKVDLQQGLASHAPSIWDGEETCDAFAFQKTGAFCNKEQDVSMNDTMDACKQATVPSPSASHEELPEMEKVTSSDLACGDLMDDGMSDHPSENSTKDFGGLTDIYWPDSLGPLDLDIPSCRYHSNDLILSDSLSGLNRLIANSVDAFQSCSFFGLDKKEPASTAEARQTASFSDFKIGSEV